MRASDRIELYCRSGKGVTAKFTRDLVGQDESTLYNLELSSVELAFAYVYHQNDLDVDSIIFDLTNYEKWQIVKNTYKDENILDTYRIFV